MDRILDLRKTKFTINEVNLGSFTLDKLQCYNLSLHVRDSDPPSVTIFFEIKKASGLVYGEDDFDDFEQEIEKFDDLKLTDKHAITGLYKMFSANPGWEKYPILARFTSRSVDRTFSVKIKSNGVSYVEIINKNPSID